MAKAVKRGPKNLGGEVRQDYFQWLCEQVHIDSSAVPFWLLAGAMHATEFSWARNIPMDENRAMDGIALREEYRRDTYRTDTVYLDELHCSVLEMLVALARRIDFELSDPDDVTDHSSSYFWEMMSNLGLMSYSDDTYVDYDGQMNVSAILNEWLNRGYSENGEGGLFPLYTPIRDQRTVEIWYQMSAYLRERYKL